LKKLKSGDVLVICGDFGFVWDGSPKEKRILDWLGNRKYTVVFLDGTHENFELLNSYRVTIWRGGRVHRVSGTLFHLMRGQIYNIDGVKLFAFGGGESQYREMKNEHENWWREELPSPEEMTQGAENIDEIGCKVDIIATHEPPSLVKSSILMRLGYPERVSKLNGYFEELNRVCEFKKWYFGCMHEDRVVTPVHTALFKKVICYQEDVGNS
jgi:hypothetical protein